MKVVTTSYLTFEDADDNSSWRVVASEEHEDRVEFQEKDWSDWENRLSIRRDELPALIEYLGQFVPQVTATATPRRRRKVNG